MSAISVPFATGVRDALASLAPLFSWPDASFADRLRRASEDAAAASSPAARALVAFAGETRALGLGALESLYTSTFDLAPSCSPYLGVHLFDEENQSRARLMIGLRSAYAKRGVELNGELPDHIALVLAFAPHFEADEWCDLVSLILTPALGTMDKTLASTTNPYRHLIGAALRLARTAAEGGGPA
jgi:nitrate reductase molybdenum cofactor assembly chaperone